MSVEIRFATIDDIEKIIDLCEAHAHYEKADYVRMGKPSRLAQDLFFNPPKLFCLVVTDDNTVVGYATYMKQYSTWDADEYIYMDCLFIEEGQRGKRIGEKLMERIKEESTKLGCSLIQWQTPEFNTGAIRFYKRIGAVSKTKERFFLG